MKDGARPAGWVAHVLTAQIADACLAHVQFFVSQEYPAPVRSIHLATKPYNVRSRGSGHIYRYYQEGLRGRLSGEAVALVTGPPATIPGRLNPVIDETNTL